MSHGKLKVVFVKPLVEYPIAQEEIGIPLAYLYLSAYLLNNANDVVEPGILDYRLNRLEDKPINPSIDFKDYDVIAIGATSAEFPLEIGYMEKILHKSPIQNYDIPQYLFRDIGISIKYQ